MLKFVKTRLFIVVLLFSFIDIFNVTPIIIMMYYTYNFFFKNNTAKIRINNKSTDVVVSSKSIRKNNNYISNAFNSVMILYFIIHLHMLDGYEEALINGHLFLSNKSMFFTSITFIIGLLFFKVITHLNEKNNIITHEYYYSVFTIIIYTYILYLSNSFYSFFFILELVSVTILYKLTLSKLWTSDLKNLYIESSSKENTRGYVNVIFFQYWVNFFSSVIIIFFIINLTYLFGSSDWFFINYLLTINDNSQYFTDMEYIHIITLLFGVSIFLKIGITPMHLFKIEIYKSIPFISIFFYTTVYFISYFIFVCIILSEYLYDLSKIVTVILWNYLILGSLYLLFLIFDVNFMKAFFAYSTIANSINFLAIILLVL